MKLFLISNMDNRYGIAFINVHNNLYGNFEIWEGIAKEQKY